MKTVSAHEQDLAHALKWWEEATELEKLTIWLAIQKFGGSDIHELIGRFAQLGFLHAALKSLEAEDGS